MDVAILDVTCIKVKENRQRQTFDKDALLALGKRIKEHGLLHPMGIDTLDSGHLVYGESRLKIITYYAKHGIAIRFNGEELPVGYAPFLVCGTTDELELEQIELAENAARQDLTWQEQTKAIKRIEELLEAKLRRENPDIANIKVPIEDIAKEAKVSKRVAYDEVDIAHYMDDPDVAKAKTKKDAQKIIAKKKTQEHRAAHADGFEAKSDDQKIFQGDCRDVIRGFPDGTFTAVITDPPYGIEMHKDQSWDGTWHEYDDTEAYCFNLVEQLLPEWDRTTRDQAHLYLFCDFAKFNSIRSIVENYKRDGKRVFEVMYFPFIWNKGNIASYPRPNHWPRKSYECVLYAIKGEHEHNGLDLAVIDVPQIQNQDHPAGKPEALYEKLVLRSTSVGDSVLDCFAGQGNLLRTCKANNRKSYNIELSDTYFPMLVEAAAETELK